MRTGSFSSETHHFLRRNLIIRSTTAYYSSVELASLEIRMARSENLPVLPQAVSEIMRLAEDPNANQRALEKAFEQDPAITAKILKVANSAYYGGNRAPTIGRAISFLGLSAIRSLVIGVSFQQMTGNKSESKHFNKVQYWLHCLSTAISCRVIAKLRLPGKGEELYCAGMVHDLGLLVLERFTPKELDAAVEMSLKQSITLLEAERLILGFDHCEVGGLLAEKWNLSELMIHGIRYHSKPLEDPTYQETTKIIHLGDKMALVCDYPGLGVDRYPDLDSFARELQVPKDQIPIIKQVVRQEVEKVMSAYNIAA